MAKSENQKLKMFYISKILEEESNMEHPISCKDLIEKLLDYDITAERKSIYTDVEYLNKFGYDIEFDSNRGSGGYYIGERKFELAELKMLVDMVQSSRFLTQKKSRELIRKLESMTDKYSASELQRSVYVDRRAKSENESVFYSVDTLNQAMNNNLSVSFQYSEYTVDKKIMLRKNGALYNVSPYYLVWNNDNYYLIGVDNTIGEIRHYRVDRMKKLSMNQDSRQYKELFKDFDIATFTKSVFNMYDGEKKKVSLCCANSLINVIIDRFGKDIITRPNADGKTFNAITEVYGGPQFYGWILGLNGQVKIESPSDICEDFKNYVGKIYNSL